MPPSFFSPDTTWTGTQILLSEQHCGAERVLCAVVVTVITSSALRGVAGGDGLLGQQSDDGGGQQAGSNKTGG